MATLTPVGPRTPRFYDVPDPEPVAVQVSPLSAALADAHFLLGRFSDRVLVRFCQLRKHRPDMTAAEVLGLALDAARREILDGDPEAGS